MFCKHPPPDLVSPRNSLGLAWLGSEPEFSPTTARNKTIIKQNVFDTMSCFNIFCKVCLRETELFNEEGVTDCSCTIRHIMEQDIMCIMCIKVSLCPTKPVSP